MLTLKLTTLAILIPLGWVVSADAYPQLLDGSSVTHEQGPQWTCRATPQRHLSHGESDEGLHAFSPSLPETIWSTSEHQDDLNAPAEICRLDLDPHNIN